MVFGNPEHSLHSPSIVKCQEEHLLDFAMVVSIVNAVNLMGNLEGL